MRAVLVLVLLFAAACARDGSPRDAGPRYISIGADALATARAVAARHGAELAILEAAGGAAVLALDDADLDALSAQMHERHGRCGGFMLHESLDDARASLRPPTAARTRPVDYTLDQAAIVREVLPALDPARILATIGELSSMKNRYYQSDTGAAASLWLRDRWRSFTSRPEVTVELFDHGYAQKSVILTIPGATRPSEVVVIGGHLDSIALGGRTSTAPGADDDASGIATLTEVARVLLAADVRPARTLQLMAYAAEEVGLRGSLSIVREYRKRGVDVVGVLQLDMTNYQGSDRDIWLINDFTDAAQNRFLGRLIDVYVGATWGFDACGYACSDHASWHRAGIPASMPFESRSSDRNRAIHTAKDTLETSGNNAAHAVKFARLAAAYAIELAKTAPAAAVPVLASPPPPSAGLAAPAEAASGLDVRALLAALGLALALACHVTVIRRL
jgi:bacterial leucyl aminopeptidase